MESTAIARILYDMGRIVVGVDATESSQHALEWAIAAARANGDLVHAVHAQRSGFHRNADGLLAISPASRMAAQGVVDQAVAAVAPRASGVEVIAEVAAGRPGPVLVRAAQGATLVVIGECESALRLSCANAEYVMKHAQCPVVVVPLSSAVAL